MENKNKPDWLIKAQEEIAKFAETKIGKMSEKEFRRKEITSFAASCVSKENNIKKGKISGQKHVESGHLKSITKLWTPYEAGLAGKKGGAKNVETGHIYKLQKVATDAAAKKLLDKKLNEIKELYSIMELDTLYSFKQLKAIVTHVKDRRLNRLLFDELSKPYIQISKIKGINFFIKTK